MSDYNKLSDNDLFAMLSQDDENAFRLLYNRYKAPLYLHACKMLHDDEEAKDIVQDTFSMIWAKRENLTITTAANSYLYSTVRNRILDHISHKKVIAKYTDSLNSFLDRSAPAHDRKIIEEELIGMFEIAVSSLPEKMREIFELSRNEGLSHKQIAEKLNISDKTVKKQISNAIKIIKIKVRILKILSFFL